MGYAVAETRRVKTIKKARASTVSGMDSRKKHKEYSHRGNHVYYKYKYYKKDGDIAQMRMENIPDPCGNMYWTYDANDKPRSVEVFTTPSEGEQTSFNLDAEDIVHLKQFIDDVYLMMLQKGLLWEVFK